MTKPLEKEVVEPSVQYARSCGWRAERFERTGTGNMDWVFFGPLEGVLFVEFKRLGKKPTKQQNHRANQFRGFGFMVHACDSKELFIDIFHAAQRKTLHGQHPTFS